MQEALVDANVVYAFRMQRDQWHDEGAAIVTAIDAGDLPRGLLTSFTLTEILTPIQHRAGHDPAVDTLDFLKRSGGFRLCHVAQEDFARAQALLPENPEVELPDLMTVAYMQRLGVEYIYSFDDDFDRFDDITRLTTPTDPFHP